MEVNSFDAFGDGEYGHVIFVEKFEILAMQDIVFCLQQSYSMEYKGACGSSVHWVDIKDIKQA